MKTILSEHVNGLDIDEIVIILQHKIGGEDISYETYQLIRQVLRKEEFVLTRIGPNQSTIYSVEVHKVFLFEFECLSLCLYNNGCRLGMPISFSFLNV